MPIQTFVTTAPNRQDPAAQRTAVRAACGDTEAGVGLFSWPQIQINKTTAWTAPQIAATQTAIDTCQALTPQIQAQNEIDDWSISQKAFALAMLDQINALRTQLGLATATPAQMLAAIRAKAGTL